MKSYVITLRNDNGPYVIIFADKFEIIENYHTHKPSAFYFWMDREIISSIDHSDVFEITELQKVGRKIVYSKV